LRQRLRGDNAMDGQAETDFLLARSGDDGISNRLSGTGRGAESLVPYLGCLWHPG